MSFESILHSRRFCLARRKDAICFLRWNMSVKPDAVMRACYQRVTKNRAFENRVSSINLKVYQNAGVDKDNDSKQSLDKHAKIAEIRRFSNKKFVSSHDLHRALIKVEEHSTKPSKRREHQFVSGIMG